MRSLLNNPSTMDDHNPVCAGDRGQAVRDDERRPPIEQPRQRASNDLLGLRVHG